mgnify:FL=1
MIDVKNVNVTIGKNRILQDISVHFEKGKIHGLIGRNGSGKTVLMKCICGFMKPTSGAVFVEGKQIGKDVDFVPNAGVIIETPGFVPFYSGYKNLDILAELNRRIGREEIEDAMRTVGLDPGLKRHVKKYSLGMRQRLGIAQAIMEKPQLLILDEPFNGLDKEGVEQMRTYFLKLKEEGATILLTSHTSEDIKLLCDTVTEMEKGRKL